MNIMNRGDIINCIHSKAKAVAIIHGSNEFPSIAGKVEFYQKGEYLLVVADICCLPENDSGFYGFHIHERKACEDANFSDSKGHYNPYPSPHPRHAGDLPPLMLCGNKAHLEVLTDRMSICEIIGRTVIIHSNPDDFTTQPSGNAGTKIACGVIKSV